MDSLGPQTSKRIIRRRLEDGKHHLDILFSRHS